MVADRGSIPLAELRTDLRKKLTASRAEIVKAVTPATRVTHTGRTTTKDSLLESMGLGDYGRTEGFDPYAGRYGSAGIAPSLSTREYTRDLVMGSRPGVDLPWYIDAWNDTPGPVQQALSHGGGAFLKALETLAVPLSLVAASAEAAILGTWGLIDYDSMPDSAKLALHEATDSVGGDPGLSFGDALGFASYIWNRKESGSHDFMYGTGDIFNTFGFLQGTRDGGFMDEFQWWANRALALAGDITMDPLAKVATFGKLAIPISRGLTSGGNAMKLLRTFTHKNLDDLAGVVRVRAGVGASSAVTADARVAGNAARKMAEAKSALRAAERSAQTALDPNTRATYNKLAERLRVHIKSLEAGVGAPRPGDVVEGVDDLVRSAIDARLLGKNSENFMIQVADDLKKGTSKVLTREGDDVFVDFGKQFLDLPGVGKGVLTDALKIKLPPNVIDDISKLTEIVAVGASHGRLQLTNEQYKFVANAMRKSDMDKHFNFAGEQVAGKVFKAITKAEADAAGLRIGIMKPFTGAASRKMILNPIRKRLKELDPLTDPIPIKLLTFSASNKFLGRPTVAFANMTRKAFVGRGDRWRSMGGRMADQRKIIRTSDDAMEVVKAKTVVGNLGRSAAQGRVAERQFGLMFQDVRDAVKTIPRLAPDHPDGGAVLMRATWGDEDAIRIVREAAGDEIAESVFTLMRRFRDEAHIRSKKDFLGFVDNYGPRQITKEAREALAKRRPGSLTRRHRRKPFDASGVEEGRKYIDHDEFEALIKKRVNEGIDPQVAREMVSKEKSSEIFGQKLFKVNTIMDDGLKAPSVEEQIAKIMDDMGIGYGMFIDNWYEVVPNYMVGLAKRVGEVYFEHLMLDSGVFVDRMAVMKQVPPRAVQAKWIRVMRAQVKLKRSAGYLQDSFTELSRAEERDLGLLRKQLAKRQAALDLAEEDYRRAVQLFDSETLEVQKTEAKVMAIQKEVSEAEMRVAEIGNKLKAGTVKNAVKLENERVKILERLATLRADDSVPKHYLETLRASTVGQLEMEHRIQAVFRDTETFDIFERLFRRWEPDTALTPETLYAYIRKNKDLEGFVGKKEFEALVKKRVNEGMDLKTARETVESENALRLADLDIIPDTKQFVLRIGKQGVENEYTEKQVLEMLLGANRMLDDVDDTPLGSWLAIELSPMQEANTLSGLRLQQYSQAYRTIRDSTKKSTAILQEWIASHPAVWQGKIPTPANVEEARVALVAFTEQAQANGQTFGSALAEIGADDVLRQHLHTYYGVHDDLNMMNMTSFGTTDTVVAQMETALRLRGNEIEQALEQFRPVAFEVQLSPGEHGRRLFGIEEYAKYQRLKEAAAQSPYAHTMPFKNAAYSIDDILANGTMTAAAGSGVGGVHGGTNPGGKYLMDTPQGPKEFYVKQYNTHASMMNEPDALDHGRRRVQGEVLGNALYREVGGDVATAPVSRAAYSSDTDSWWVVSEWLDNVLPVGTTAQPKVVSQDMRLYMQGGGLPKLISAEQATALAADAVNIRPVYDMLGDNYLTDVLLANWDAVGANIENIGIAQSGRLVRIDNGAVFNFRATGPLKTADLPSWNYRAVSEIDSLRDLVVASEYAPMIRKWEEGLTEGITAELGKQWQQLDKVRKSYMGWEGFVRKYLPDAQYAHAQEFVQFLEQRHKYLADKLHQVHNEGMELVAEALAARGIPVPEIEKAVRGTYSPRTQITSKARKYDPWLSPDGESQALDTFSFETAQKRIGNPRGNKAKQRDLEVLDQVEDWLDGNVGLARRFKDTQEDARRHGVANMSPEEQFLGGVEAEMFMATSEFNRTNLLDSVDVLRANYDDVMADRLRPNVETPPMWETGPNVSYGIVLLDDQGRYIMRMPTDGANGKPFGGVEWTFPKGKANVVDGVMETPAQAALRETLEETGLEAHILDVMPEPLTGTTGETYYYIGKVKGQAHETSGAPSIISTKSLGGPTPVTSDPNTWAAVTTLFHRGRTSQVIDPSGVNVGGTGVGWPDAWGLNMTPGATQNVMTTGSPHMYAVDVNVGIGGERVRTYGLPSNLSAAAVANARAQTIHASQGTLDDALQRFTRELEGVSGLWESKNISQVVTNSDMSLDMFGRIHGSDPQLYEDLRKYFRTNTKMATTEWTAAWSRELADQMGLLDDLAKFGIHALDAMDYQTKALFVAHLQSTKRVVNGKFVIDDSVLMENTVVDFLARIDEKLNPIDAWSYKVQLMTDLELMPARLGEGRKHLAAMAAGEAPTGQGGILSGIGRQPSLARGETPIALRGSSGFESVPAEGWSSTGGAMRYERFMDVYRRSMIADGYTTAAWINPEQYSLGTRQVLGYGGEAGMFNAILVDPLAVGVTPATISKQMEDVAGMGRVGAGGYSKPGILDIEDFLLNYERFAEEQLIGKARRTLDPGDPVENLYQTKVRAAEDLDGPGGAKEQLNAAVERMEIARQVREDARLEAAKAKSKTRGAKSTKVRKGEPSKKQITERALQILNDNPTKPATLKTESQRNAFAGTDRELRAQARADLLQKPEGAEAVSKINELNTLISQAEKRRDAADAANAILHRLGTVDKFGRAVPLEKLSNEVRNLKISVGALMDADAQQMNLALKELESGADAAKWLRQVGEYGDDEIWFPLKRGFREERLLDFSFEAGFKPFGVMSQGPAEMVESMTAVTKFRGGGGAMGRFLRHYDKVHNLVKGYMIMKPGFHMRNYFSAVFMNYLAGVQTSSYRQFQNAYWNYQHERAVELGLTARAASLKNSLKKRLIFKEASVDDVAIIRHMDQEGILGGAQGQIGVEQVMAGGPKANTKIKRALQAMNPFSSRNAPLRISKEAGMGVETFVRGVMGFDSLKSGVGVDEAFERIMKFHFDYSDLSDFEQGVVKRLVPFYTWTRKNLPLMIEQIGANPKVFNQYNIVKKNIEGDEPRTAPVPPWMQRQGGIQLPFKYEGENMWILPDLPFKTPLEMLDPILALDSSNPMERAEAAISTMFTQMTPLVKGPVEWASNRNFWKGYDFTGKYVQVPTIYTKIPLLMPMLQATTGKNPLAEKNENGIWMMRDKDLHVMAMMLPVFSDMRRLFPTEERYQQRTLSTWMSWWAGIGLRTNTRDEQERTIQAAINTAREERAKEYKRTAAGLKP